MYTSLYTLLCIHVYLIMYTCKKIMYTCLDKYVYMQDSYVYIIMYTCKIIMYTCIDNYRPPGEFQRKKKVFKKAHFDSKKG